jgi:hypothetical protein
VHTMAMLRRHGELMNERAAAWNFGWVRDGFLFSLEPDCSKPLHPDFVTKRVGVLKAHLGIAENGPETIVLQDEALRLFRLPSAEWCTGASPHSVPPRRPIGLYSFGMHAAGVASVFRQTPLHLAVHLAIITASIGRPGWLGTSSPSAAVTAK